MKKITELFLLFIVVNIFFSCWRKNETVSKPQVPVLVEVTVLRDTKIFSEQTKSDDISIPGIEIGELKSGTKVKVVGVMHYKEVFFADNKRYAIIEGGGLVYSGDLQFDNYNESTKFKYFVKDNAFYRDDGEKVVNLLEKDVTKISGEKVFFAMNYGSGNVFFSEYEKGGLYLFDKNGTLINIYFTDIYDYNGLVEFSYVRKIPNSQFYIFMYDYKFYLFEFSNIKDLVYSFDDVPYYLMNDNQYIVYTAKSSMIKHAVLSGDGGIWCGYDEDNTNPSASRTCYRDIVAYNIVTREAFIILKSDENTEYVVSDEGYVYTYVSEDMGFNATSVKIEKYSVKDPEDWLGGGGKIKQEIIVLTNDQVKKAEAEAKAKMTTEQE